MKISPVQNSNINKYNSPQFKGIVSPEFVKYVNALRCDCIDTVPKQSSDLINNVCDNIINKAQRVMKNCFPQESVLNVDEYTSKKRDAITYANSILQNHFPGYIYDAYFIKKDKNATPIHRLNVLHKAIIKGHCFAGASRKEYVALYYLIDYIKSSGSSFHSDNLNKDEFLADSMNLLEFWYNKIKLLGSEINADDWCKLITQSEYANILNVVKSMKENSAKIG